MNPTDSYTPDTATNSQDARRKPRRAPVGTVEVINTMSDRVIGQLGNVSETGMLLLASTPLVEDALYQLRFILPGTAPQRGSVEVGVHLLWHEHASAAGKAWAGFRFINLPEPGRQHLRDWLARTV